MSILITTLLVLAGVVALIFIVALFTARAYKVEREIIIDAPATRVFDYIKLISNQDNFNKWLMADPAMKRDAKGTDGKVGFIYQWSGNKHGGPGEQEIMSIIEGKNIVSEIRFAEPFAGIAPHIVMTTESVSASSTKVSWSNASKIKYPANIMLPMVKKMLAKDLDTSLNNLKIILEKYGIDGVCSLMLIASLLMQGSSM